MIFNPNILYHPQNYIRGMLNPLSGVQAYFIEKNVITLNLGNILRVPLEIEKIIINEIEYLLGNYICISPRMQNKPASFQSFQFEGEKIRGYGNNKSKNGTILLNS